METTQMPVNKWIDKENLHVHTVHIYTMEYYAALKKKELLSFAKKMDNHVGHYLKWNKLDTDRQVLPNLAFMWNLK